MAESKITTEYNTTTFSGPPNPVLTRTVTPIWYPAMRVNKGPLINPHLGISGLIVSIVGGLLALGMIVSLVMHCHRRRRHEQEEDMPIQLQNLGHHGLHGVQVLHMPPRPLVNGRPTVPPPSNANDTLVEI